MKGKGRTKELLNNKKNLRFYESHGSYECGMVLTGHLSKRIIGHRVSLNGCYGWIRKNEIWLKGIDPKEEVKLLLNRWELDQIIRQVKEKGYLLIPESLYLKNHRVKVSLMLAKRISYTSKQKLETIKRKDEKKMRKWDY